MGTGNSFSRVSLEVPVCVSMRRATPKPLTFDPFI